MRQIRELLHLHFEQGLSQRLMARSLGVARSTVERLLARFTMSGLTCPPDPALTDAELERRLYRGQRHRGTAKPCVRPNYGEVSQQLSRKGVTRCLLWREYRDLHEDGVGYSVFCDELAAYLADRDLSYRHDHVPGEKAYFDFAGMTLRYRDGDAERAAQIFVAVLGYSNATFAHGFSDQTAASWLDGQHRAFVAFGGVPKVSVPDNPKALVAKADRFEPRLTQGYIDFARHYSLTIIPARVRKPKDKAAVEGAVKIDEMRILATARDRVFASLDALNAWLHEALVTLNASPFQKRVGSRASLLAEEQAHLLPLPQSRFELPVYLTRKLARDYHVDVHRQYYSAPCQHVGQTVEVRLTRAHVEALLADTRIALHPRAAASQRFVTDPAHMPAHHRAFHDPRIMSRAAAIGPATVALIDALFARRRHPEQAIRAAQGVLGLRRDHGVNALEAACASAVAINAIGYGNVLHLLRAPPSQAVLPLAPIAHEHVRGAHYFNPTETSHAA